MIKVVNRVIPFKGFMAMAIWPFCFIRKEHVSKFTPEIENHERIHFRQTTEMLVVFFYVWYVLEWMIKFPLYGYRSKIAYYNLSFEREARAFQNDFEYLKGKRKFWSFIKYL